jgi:dihydrofolate reductase
MRRTIYGAAMSLDAYIAGPDGEVDWLQWNDEVAEISKETWKRVDTVLLGRKTYEVAVRNGMRAYPGVRNIVFSRTLRPNSAMNVTIVWRTP